MRGCCWQIGRGRAVRHGCAGWLQRLKWSDGGVEEGEQLPAIRMAARSEAATETRLGCYTCVPRCDACLLFDFTLALWARWACSLHPPCSHPLASHDSSSFLTAMPINYDTTATLRRYN